MSRRNTGTRNLCGKYFRQVEKRLRVAGYRLASEDRYGVLLYEHDNLPDVSVNPTVKEHIARRLIEQIDRNLGVAKQVNKRNATVIKERAARERDRANAEMAAIDAKRAQILAEKEALPVGDLNHLDRARRIAIEREVESLDRERKKWEKLMTEIPVGLNNSVRHTAGGTR